MAKIIGMTFESADALVKWFQENAKEFTKGDKYIISDDTHDATLTKLQGIESELGVKKTAEEVSKTEIEKIKKELEAATKALEEAKKKSGDVDTTKKQNDDLSARIDLLTKELENQKQTAAQALANAAQEREQMMVKDAVSKALIANQFRDEQVAEIDRYTSMFKVVDGKIVSTQDMSLGVDDFIKGYAEKNPYLLRPSTPGGLNQGTGSNPYTPKPVDQMSDEELIMSAFGQVERNGY